MAVHRPTRTAVVADLHLGVGHVRRRGGDAVPEAHADDTADVFRALAARHGVESLVVAGDLIEDGRANDAVAAWRDGLAAAGVELIAVVPGNHDRHLVGGTLPLFPAGYPLGRWMVVHGDAALPAGPVVHGHVHPCLRWDEVRTGPCFLLGEDRLVLPAYSADAAGGTNVLGRGRWAGCRCWVVAGARVLDFGTVGELTRKRRAR